jgi:hypothetical protein
MEPEVSLPCLQEPSAVPYPESDQCSPYHPILSLLKIHFNINHRPQPITLPHNFLFLRSSSSHQRFVGSRANHGPKDYLFVGNMCDSYVVERRGLRRTISRVQGLLGSAVESGLSPYNTPTDCRVFGGTFVSIVESFGVSFEPK